MGSMQAGRGTPWEEQALGGVTAWSRGIYKQTQQTLTPSTSLLLPIARRVGRQSGRQAGRQVEGQGGRLPGPHLQVLDDGVVRVDLQDAPPSHELHLPNRRGRKREGEGNGQGKNQTVRG